MGHRLDDAVVEVEGCFDQLFAIACRARAHDVEYGSAFFCLLLQTFQSFLHGMNRIAEIHAVVVEDDLTLMAFVSAHHDELCRRGARVDADDHLFASAAHGIERRGIALFVVKPCCIFSLRAEERLQLVGRYGSCVSTTLVATAAFRMGDAVEQFVNVHRFGLLPGTDGTAERRDEVALFEHDEVFSFEMKIVGKRLAQGREECQRTAAKEDWRREVDAVAQRGDGLHGDTVEDTGGDVAFRQVARHEVLHIGLGKDTTACGHRIDMGGGHGQLAHALVVAAEQQGHLIDKRAGASRAVAVHAQFRALTIEEDHLGILAADVHECTGLGIAVAGKHRGSHNLLDKLRAELVGSGHTHRSGHTKAQYRIAELMLDLVEIGRGQFPHLGVVPPIL